MSFTTRKAHSPNFDERNPDVKICVIIIHHTELNNAKDVYDIFEKPESKVSSHFLIDRDGALHQFVDENKRAWHAGISTWQNMVKLNDYSIGIELDNNGKEDFAKPLMQTLVSLCKQLINKYKIEEINILGHSDIAYWRKVDPSIKFDWKWLASQGIGFFPQFTCDPKPMSHDGVINRLHKFGYKLPENENELSELLKAFKRRYTPESYDLGIWDTLADGRLNELIKHYEL